MKFGILLHNKNKMRFVRYVLIWYIQLDYTKLFQLMHSFGNKSPIETYKLNVLPIYVFNINKWKGMIIDTPYPFLREKNIDEI